MNDEQITAILGLALLTQPNHTIEVPMELVANGLPENSGVRVIRDNERDVIRIFIEELPEEVDEEVEEE